MPDLLEQLNLGPRKEARGSLLSQLGLEEKVPGKVSSPLLPRPTPEEMKTRELLGIPVGKPITPSPFITKPVTGPAAVPVDIAEAIAHLGKGALGYIPSKAEQFERLAVGTAAGLSPEELKAEAAKAGAWLGPGPETTVARSIGEALEPIFRAPQDIINVLTEPRTTADRMFLGFITEDEKADEPLFNISSDTAEKLDLWAKTVLGTALELGMFKVIGEVIRKVVPKKGAKPTVEDLKKVAEEVESKFPSEAEIRAKRLKEEKAPEIAPTAEELAELREYGTADSILERITPKPKAPIKKVSRIPRFKSPEEAIDFGSKATPEQVKRMERLRRDHIKKSEKLRAEDKADEAWPHAMAAQYLKEAIDASTGDLVRGKLKPTEPEVAAEPTPPKVEPVSGVVKSSEEGLVAPKVVKLREKVYDPATGEVLTDFRIKEGPGPHEIDVTLLKGTDLLKYGKYIPVGVWRTMKGKQVIQANWLIEGYNPKTGKWRWIDTATDRAEAQALLNKWKGYMRPEVTPPPEVAPEVAPPPAPKPPKISDQIRTLFNEGKDASEIAKDVKMSEEVVAMALTEMKLSKGRKTVTMKEVEAEAKKILKDSKDLNEVYTRMQELTSRYEENLDAGFADSFELNRYREWGDELMGKIIDTRRKADLVPEPDPEAPISMVTKEGVRETFIDPTDKGGFSSAKVAETYRKLNPEVGEVVENPNAPGQFVFRARPEVTLEMGGMQAFYKMISEAGRRLEERLVREFGKAKTFDEAAYITRSGEYLRRPEGGTHWGVDRHVFGDTAIPGQVARETGMLEAFRYEKGGPINVRAYTRLSEWQRDRLRKLSEEPGEMLMDIYDVKGDPLRVYTKEEMHTFFAHTSPPRSGVALEIGGFQAMYEALAGRLKRRAGEKLTPEVREVLDKGRIIKQRKVKGRIYPPVYEAQLEILKGCRKLDQTTFHRGFENPIRTFEDAGGQAFLDLTVHEYHAREFAIAKMIRKFRRDRKEISKGLKRKERERIMIHAVASEKGGMVKLKHMGYKEADLPKLSPKERAAYDALRARYEAWYTRLNRVRKVSLH